MEEDEDDEVPDLVPDEGPPGPGPAEAGGGAEAAAGGGAGAAAVPLTMVTGALGAGKTTLVNNILTAPRLDLRLAVILNEFGASAGVERSFLAGGGAREEVPVEEWVELPNGCLCCTVKADFLVALEQLLRQAAGRVDHILLETTGLADPGPILQALWTDDELEAGVYLDGVVTVIDAAHWRKQLPGEGADAGADAGGDGGVGEFVSQVLHADVVLLNKLDLVADQGRAARAFVLGVNAAAEVLPCTRSRVDVAPLLRRNSLGADRRRPPPALALAEPLQANHDQRIRTVAIELPEPVAAEAFEAWVEALVWPGEALPGRRRQQVFRLKGVVAFAGEAEKRMLQGVHELYELVRGPAWGPGEPRASRIVVIGRDLDEAALAAGAWSCVPPEARGARPAWPGARGRRGTRRPFSDDGDGDGDGG